MEARTEGLTHRLAEEADLDPIRALMDRSIHALLAAFLSPEEVEASFDHMGLDTQLIADRTYFLIEDPAATDPATGRARLVGCGGWSPRATLFGGDHTPNRDARFLDPASEPARVRAMYTDPAYARRGIGRLVIALCEDAARAAGFSRVVLGATVAGEPFYLACGYDVVERMSVEARGLTLPLTHMIKTLSP